MNFFRIIAIVLIVAGALALAYQTFTFVTETHDADLGPISVRVQEKETVSIPPWAAAIAIALGVALLFAPAKGAWVARGGFVAMEPITTKKRESGRTPPSRKELTREEKFDRSKNVQASRLDSSHRNERMKQDKKKSRS